MSFILDALRAQKAHDAQSIDAAPILAETVSEAPANPQARVIWTAAGVLTLIAVALIAWTAGREGSAPVVPSTATAAPAATVAPSPFARSDDREPVRRDVRSLGAEAARARPAAPTPAPAAAPEPDTEGMIPINPSPGRQTQQAQMITPSGAAAPAMPQPATQTAPAQPAPAAEPGLPDYENMLLGGQINLPNLRLDMHVFHNTPERRFVFINFKKFREGDSLDADTVIEQITAGGAVLNHNGRRFVLRPN